MSIINAEEDHDPSKDNLYESHCETSDTEDYTLDDLQCFLEGGGAKLKKVWST